MRYFISVLMFISADLLAQTSELEKFENLKRMKVEFSDTFDQQQKRANEYASRNNVPLKQYLSGGNLIQLIDVDSFGRPVFRETNNNELAISINVPKIRVGGGLGLDLKGEGLEVGVWDGGPVADHLEFVDRILSKESGTGLDHATHVSGTILASGFNATAMGMAPRAKLFSFDWNNDRAEMIAKARPDQNGLLFSNHSYSIVLGWNCSNGSCSWQGQPSISDKEDWRFGFYTSLARDIDNIAFNAPYYSIFWAAGNNRGETTTAGAALYPPDGNQGSGYDCIVQEGTAKNIFTIGATRKVLSYESPQSVEMSSFSGWGPTDDGRIKPDLVAPGVSIFSTVATSNYANNSGTSMATPGALGSLMLLQELHRDLNGGKFMLSATLKALAIHTAKEAGQYPGPDYRYGWGLIDVEAGAKVLLTQDDQNVFVKELELQDGQKYELALTPKPNTKITATIVWTDPAGNPVGSSLDPTDLMLVNDLDLRIVDDASNKQFPWKLNPDVAALGEPAFKGDNFRDNVEKIEFENPEPRNYTLQVSHKSTLAGGSQRFSLILTYTSMTDPQVAYYWVGGTGDFNDPNHWALTSGGLSSQVIPNGNHRIIVDENSFNGNNQSISLSENTVIGSITWLNKSPSGIALNGNILKIRGNLVLSSDKAEILTPGKIHFSGDLNSENRLLAVDNDFSKAELEIDINSELEMVGALKAGSVNFLSGYLTMLGFKLEASSFKTIQETTKTLNITDSNLLIRREFDIDSKFLELISNDAMLITGSNVILNLGSREFNGKVIINHDAFLFGNNQIKELEVSAEAVIEGNNSISKFTLKDNATLTLNEGTVQNLTQQTNILSAQDRPIRIRSTSQKAFLNFNGRSKVCFDYLTITNVDVIGESVINAGLSSTLENSQNWEKDECGKILFPDFVVVSNCVNGLISLQDNSEGLINTYQWATTSSNALLINQNSKEGAIIFSETGNFEISLTISNNNDSRTFKQLITINPNDLPPNQIILNGLNFFSTNSSPTYEWYKDFMLIPNTSGRSYPFNGEPGTYFVLTKSDICNRVSNSVVITSLESRNNRLSIYPNPAEDKISIGGLEVISKIDVYNNLGYLVYEIDGVNDFSIETTNWPRGMYFIKIKNEEGLLMKKIILK